MNLKDCKFAALNILPAHSLLEAFASNGEFEPAELPAGAVVHALVYDSPTTVLVAYTLAVQGRSQEDIDRLARLGVRKGMYLTEKEALDKLTTYALHQYGVPELALLSRGDYNDLATWLRNVEVTPPASAL